MTKPRSAKRTEEVAHKIELVQGVEGMCVYMNDFRIVGPKPWGGGTCIRSWSLSKADLETAINMWEPPPPLRAKRRKK